MLTSKILITVAAALLVAALCLVSISKFPGIKMQKNRGSVNVLETFWPRFHTDPKKLRTAGDWVGLQNIYSTLVEISGSMDVQADLAESWVRDPDGKKWTFKLRENLKWSDGSPMTSEQILWSLNRAYEGTTHTKLKSFVNKIYIGNPNEIVFELDQTPENFLVLLSYVDLSIVHEKSNLPEGFTWDAPLSGPYIPELVDENNMILNVNPHHWSYSKSFVPKFNLLRATATRADIDVLLSGKIDVCHTSPGLIEDRDIKPLSDTFTVLTGDSDFLVTLFFSPKRASDPLWSDKNRKSLLKNLYQKFWASSPGSLFRATGLRPPGSKGALDFSEFDEIFNSLKVEPIHFNREIELLVQDRHAERESFDKILTALRGMGAEVRVLVEKSAEYHKKFDQREFDLTYLPLGASEGDPDSAWRIYNDDFIRPAASDNELKEAQNESNEAKRNSAYKEFEKRAIADALFVPLKNEATYILMGKNVFLDTDISRDWGVKLTKVRLK